MKPPARFTAIQPHRLFPAQRMVMDLDTAALLLGTPRELLETQLRGVSREELGPELAAVHELDGEADAEGDFLRDLRLEEAYPLGAVPTCRDIRRGRTA